MKKLSAVKKHCEGRYCLECEFYEERWGGRQARARLLLSHENARRLGHGEDTRDFAQGKGQMIYLLLSVALAVAIVFAIVQIAKSDALDGFFTMAMWAFAAIPFAIWKWVEIFMKAVKYVRIHWR